MPLSLLRKLVRNFPENGPKLLLENPANVRDLLKLLHEPLVDAIDFSAMSVERTHFVQPDYRHVAVDLLLKAPLHAEKSDTILIYLLVEQQSKPQRFLQLRLIEYLVECYKMQKRIWDERHDSDADFMLHPVLPIVLYTGERSWERLESLAELVECGDRFRDVLPNIAPRFLNLRETPIENLERDGGFFGQVLWLIQQRHSDEDAFHRMLERVMANLEAMSEQERERWVEFLSYTLALVYHARNEREHSYLRDVVDRSVQTDLHRQEYTKMGRTIAEMFVDQGIEKGTLATERAILLRQLRRRFKRVPKKVGTRIAETTDLHLLESWLDNVVDADTLADVGIPLD